MFHLFSVYALGAHILSKNEMPFNNSVLNYLKWLNLIPQHPEIFPLGAQSNTMVNINNPSFPFVFLMPSYCLMAPSWRLAKDTKGLIFIRLKKNRPCTSWNGWQVTRILELGQCRWVGGGGRWISERWISFPTADWHPYQDHGQFWMIEQFKIFFFFNLTQFFHFYRQLWLMVGHAGALADWKLLTGFWVLCPNMTLTDSGKFLRLGGPLPRLEIFPGEQETSETSRPQMGCFPLLIPRSWWTIAKRVWGSQSCGTVFKAISIAMESLSLESQAMVYKTIARLDQTQHKLPWAKEIQAVW